MEDTPVPFLYALASSLAIDPGDRIVLPPEVSTVQVESSRLGRVGVPRSVIDWPKPGGAGSSLDLSRTEAISASTAEMLYTSRLQAVGADSTVYRADRGLPCDLIHGNFPILAYGFVMEAAEDPTRPRQYRSGLEPTVAPCGNASRCFEARAGTGDRCLCFLRVSIVLDRIGI